MNKFLFAMLLALSLASAGWVVQISNASLSLAKAGSISGVEYRNGGIEYASAYGKYMVGAAQSDSSVSVVISGEDESIPLLERELYFLASKGMLKAECKDYLIYNVSASGYEACGGKAVVFYCPSCEIAQREAAKPQATGASLPGAGAPAMPGPPGAPLPGDGTSGQGKQAAADRSLLQAGAQEKEGGGMGAEQVLQLFAAFLIVVVASYLLLQMFQARQPPAPAQEPDPHALELLRNQTRQGIMQELSVADKIPTDLSIKLGKSKASIVEHLDALMSAGLVEKLETPGRKFVYYRLTQKGKQLLLKMAA